MYSMLFIMRMMLLMAFLAISTRMTTADMVEITCEHCDDACKQKCSDELVMRPEEYICNTNPYNGPMVGCVCDVCNDCNYDYKIPYSCLVCDKHVTKCDDQSNCSRMCGGTLVSYSCVADGIYNVQCGTINKCNACDGACQSACTQYCTTRPGKTVALYECHYGLKNDVQFVCNCNPAPSPTPNPDDGGGDGVKADSGSGSMAWLWITGSLVAICCVFGYVKRETLLPFVRENFQKQNGSTSSNTPGTNNNAPYVAIH